MSQSPHPLVQQARDALNRGEVEQALALAEARLRTPPDDVDALEIVALGQSARGELDGAIATLRRIIALAPASDWARDDLVLTLLRAGRRPEAEVAAREALAANFDNPQAHAAFGSILSERRDLIAGEKHYRQALALAGEHPPTLTNLAVNLIEQGRLDEAEPLLARADAFAPGDGATLAQWSRLREARGDLAGAHALLDRAEAAGVDVSLRRAVCLGREKRWADAIAVIDAASSAPGGDALLERGRAHEKLGQATKAWSDFTAGKARLAARDGLAYDAQAVEGHFADLKAAFTAKTFPRLPKARRRHDVPQPIFILGFPRSGTTLVEQVLSSHGQVAAGGELPFVTEMIDLVERAFLGGQPFPQGRARLWTADAAHAADLLRDHYLARAAAWGLLDTGKRFFTDKMPLNEVYLPLIRMAFPEAGVVRLARHPLDVAVSVMANNLTHGFNCGYAIGDVVHHLAAVHDLNRHYGQALDAREHVLKYEALVADQEGETRRLLDHLGLPFEPGCLAFHENRRHAPTPSYAQVTETLNDRSIGRWKRHAEPLAPHVPSLAAIIAELGYEA